MRGPSPISEGAAVSVTAMMRQLVTVEKADTSTRDSSGGIIDSSWSTEFANVRGQLHPVGASQQAIFAQAGMTITHQFDTFQPAIKAGRRLKDATGTYYRVRTVQAVPKSGPLGGFYRVLVEEVRLS